MQTTFDIEAARRSQRSRAKAKQAGLNALFQEASADFDAIVDMIVRAYRPDRLYQWGSLLDRDKFTSMSDIDIGIVGVTDPASFFRLLRDAEVLSRFPVHIVQMDRIEPEFREIIEQRGRVVYERKD
jgi:predicted nucleotidyltransferase